MKAGMKDLALVALAGGLLAFEVATLGAALPGVKRALADRGLLGTVGVASAAAAGATSSAVVQARPTASHATVGAVKGAAHLLAAMAAPGPSQCCVVVTRRQDGRRAHRRLHFVTAGRDRFRAPQAVMPRPEQVRETERAVESVLKEAAL